MKFDKISYQILLHDKKRNGAPIRSDVTGYTTDELPGVAFRKRDGFWYVDHLASGALVVPVGCATRKAAALEYSSFYKAKFESLPVETLKKYTDAFNNAPAEPAEPEPQKGENTMKKNYFAGLETPAEINRVYKTLSAVFHPDNGGDLETMQELNRQRSAALAALEQGETVTAEAVQEIPAAVIGLPEKSQSTTSLTEALKSLIDKAQTVPGVHLELCGSWLWATGNTKPVKDDLKALGFRWSHNKAAWYWRDPSKPYFRRGGRKYSMDEIRDKYDSVKIA
jgi:hypothetical protein